MKKFLSIGAGLLFAVAAIAGPNSITFIFGTIATNGVTTGTVTNSTLPPDSYIDMISIDVSGTATNIDIDIATKGGTGNWPARTILTVDDMTADGVYYPRIFSVDDTSGSAKTQVEGTRIPLVSDYIQCWMQAETTGVTAQVWIILSDTP